MIIRFKFYTIKFKESDKLESDHVFIYFQTKNNLELAAPYVQPVGRSRDYDTTGPGSSTDGRGRGTRPPTHGSYCFGARVHAPSAVLVLPSSSLLGVAVAASLWSLEMHKHAIPANSSDCSAGKLLFFFLSEWHYCPPLTRDVVSHMKSNIKSMLHLDWHLYRRHPRSRKCLNMHRALRAGDGMS